MIPIRSGQRANNVYRLMLTAEEKSPGELRTASAADQQDRPSEHRAPSEERIQRVSAAVSARAATSKQRRQPQLALPAAETLGEHPRTLNKSRQMTSHSPMVLTKLEIPGKERKGRVRKWEPTFLAEFIRAYSTVFMVVCVSVTR
ncbi:hypothetical protein MTO96_052373 [Rhipicephalus appendiculatus]